MMLTKPMTSVLGARLGSIASVCSQVYSNSGNIISCGRLQFACHDKLLWKAVTSGNISNYVTNCSQVNDVELTQKKCVPCNSEDLRPMANDAAEELLKKVPGWSITNIDGKLKLHKSWKTKSFIKALEFFKHVGDIAEAEGHHPDLHLVNWNDASIDIWTHSVGGLTENDFILAAKISSFNAHPFLRKKAVAKASSSSS